MLYINKIDKVVTFNPLDDIVIFGGIEGRLYYSSIVFNKPKIILSKSDESKFYLFNNTLYISKPVNKANIMSYDIIKYNLSSGKTLPFLKDFFPLIQNKSKLLLKGYASNENKTIQIDLRTTFFDWVNGFDFRPIYTDDTIYLGFKGRKRDVLIGVGPEDGNEVWNFKPSNLGTWFDYDKTEKPFQILKILGIHKKEIFIYLNNGHILVLNLETGKKIAVITNDKNINQGFFSGSFSSNIQFDVVNNKLIQLFRKTYTELDLDTKKVIQYEIPDLTKLGLENTSNFVFDDDFIYFTDKNKHKLGKLNRENLKIQWEFSFTQTSNNSNAYGRLLKLKGNHLYVLDNNQTLHIFEKTENETT